MANTKKIVFSHIIRHADWPHVTAAFKQSVTVDGDVFEKPVEKDCSSPAVMKAAEALEKAVLKEIGGEISPRAFFHPTRQKELAKQKKVSLSVEQ